MTRFRLPLLLALAATTFAVPGSASAGCTSRSPLPADKRAANIYCDDVRPGMVMIMPSMKYGATQCAASFAFMDQRGNRYLSVPGSCHLEYECLDDEIKDLLPPPLNELPPLPLCLLATDSELEPTYKKGGPVVKNAEGDRIGTIAYAVNKEGVNFALVRVDRHLRLDPSLPYYGGPTKIANPRTLEETYVFSPERYPVVPNARTGILWGDATSATVTTEGFLSLTHGTSVMKPDGSAVGLFNGYLTLTGYQTQPLRAALERAERRTGLKLRLMTAKLR